MGSIIYGDAIHITEQAKIDAARITQKSGNERQGAMSQLARFSANLRNMDALDNAGDQINSTTENIGRNLDAAASGRLSERVQAAEELGSNVAMAAAAGVGGSSLEQYNATVRLNRDMVNESNDRAVTSDLYLASQSKGMAIRNAAAAQDNSVYSANLDFNQYVDHKKMGMFSKVLAVGLTAAATYFGGPKAGSAVMGMFEARQAANNGDFGTASRSMTSALKSGVSAGVDAYKSGGGPDAPAKKWDSIFSFKRNNNAGSGSVTIK